MAAVHRMEYMMAALQYNEWMKISAPRSVTVFLCKMYELCSKIKIIVTHLLY